jgi:hypothetical protein
LAPSLITIEATHWFYKNFGGGSAYDTDIDEASQIAMLQRWSIVLPWKLEKMLNHYMRHLWAKSLMHLWTGLGASFILYTFSPIMSLFLVRDDDAYAYILLPTTYATSLALGKLLLPSRRWNTVVMKYEGSNVNHSKKIIYNMKYHDDGTIGDVDDDDDDGTTESTDNTENSSGSGGDSAAAPSSPRTPLKNHHLFRLQASPSSHSNRNSHANLDVKNDEPESDELASESDSESLKTLLPKSSPILARMKQSTTVHERRNPGTPRGAGSRRRVGSYYS